VRFAVWVQWEEQLIRRIGERYYEHLRRKARRYGVQKVFEDFAPPVLCDRGCNQCVDCRRNRQQGDDTAVT
jgi:hypothetical protein